MDTTQFEHLDVRVGDDGRVCTVTFDHGKANEMGRAQLQEIERLTAMLPGSDVMTLITTSRRVTSKGTPIFVSGANVTERVGWMTEEVRAHVRWQREVLTALRHAPVFHVAVVGGIALGWGTEYLLGCDWRIACPGAVFGLPETGLGILPGAGGTAELWAHVGVPMALRLGMTGERIDHVEALRIGLVQEVAADLDAGLDRAHALAAQVSTRSPTAMAAFKRAVLAAVGGRADERAAIESAAYERCLDSGEAAIGRAHFADVTAGRRPPWGPRTL